MLVYFQRLRQEQKSFNMFNPFVLISTMCTYPIAESDRTLRELSKAGFGLKIGYLFTKISPFCENG